MNEVNAVNILIRILALLLSSTISYYILRKGVYEEIGDGAKHIIYLFLIFTALVLVRIWI